MYRTLAAIGCLLLVLGGAASVYEWRSEMSDAEKRMPVLAKMYLTGRIIVALIGLVGLVWILAGGELS